MKKKVFGFTLISVPFIFLWVVSYISNPTRTIQLTVLIGCMAAFVILIVAGLIMILEEK